MTFEASDFPLFLLLRSLNEPGIEHAEAEFQKAYTGNIQDKVRFAMGIQTIPVNPGWENIPGATEEMMRQTLHKCLEIFKEGAAAGDDRSRYMVSSYADRGIQ